MGKVLATHYCKKTKWWLIGRYRPRQKKKQKQIQKKKKNKYKRVKGIKGRWRAPPRSLIRDAYAPPPPPFLERSDFLQFDFRRFCGSAALAYKECSPYTLDECLEVFRVYFQAYEEYMGHPHPPIRREQIARIMQEMPWIDEIRKTSDSYIADIDPNTYKYIIRLHFKTKYRRCDYNINHFFSGRIRELRLYEVIAGYE